MKHSPQARILVSTLTAVITMAVAWSVMHAPIRMPASKDVASAQSKLTAHSQSKSSRSTSTIHKPSASVSVVIDQIEQTLPTLGLRGQIRAEHALSGYQFAWIVADSDRIVDSAVTGSVPTMSAGDTFDIKIQVAPSPQSKSPIVLHVYQLINGEPRGVIAQWDFPTNRRAEQSGTGEKAAQLPDGLVQ